MNKSLQLNRWAKEGQGIKRLIRAQAEDFKRRGLILEGGNLSRRLRMEYAYLNSKIYEGAAEIIGPRFAETFIEEIGGGVGYAKSAVEFLSEAAYKEYKTEIVCNIAKKLYLWE